MEWTGQLIYDYVAKFRNNVTIEGSLTFDSVGLTAVQTSAESFVDNDTSVMTSAAIADKIEAYGYSTGDITGVRFTTDDTNTATDSSGSADFTIAGGLGIDTSASGTTVTIAGEEANAENAGVVELATTAETTTGTDTARAVTPDGLKDGYRGSTNVTTLGTIATGTWEGTDVGVAHGGTGASTLTDGGILLGSGTGAITATAVLGDGEILIGDGTTDPVALDVGSSTAITVLGTVATGTWEGTAIASDQQKHVMHYQTTGYATGDGTNYEISKQISANTAPFQHDVSIGADGLTAQTPQQWMRTQGHVMPRACTLKRWTGWAASAGSGTTYVGLFKVTMTRDSSTTVSAVLLEEFSYTALGNNKNEDFDETSFTATAIAAGDVVFTAMKGVNAKAMYFNGTFEVEF